MKLLKAASLLALGASTVAATEDITCPSGRWGANCQSYCGACASNHDCNALTGACELAMCDQGWMGPLCNEPVCEPSTCEDKGGHCIAPNVCACPSSEVNTVASIKINQKNPSDYEVTCDNLKQSGMKGAGVGFLVLTASITMCGVVERQINKGKAMGNARWHADE